MRQGAAAWPLAAHAADRRDAGLARCAPCPCPTASKTFGEATDTEVCDSDQSPYTGASVSLFIDLLRWRDACRGRDSLAALMGAGMLLINNGGRGLGISPGRICTQRVEACFLLVAKPLVEALKWRPHRLHGLQHNL